MMRVLIACDAFKDALTAADVCEAIATGIRQSGKPADIRLMPLADGGEGTVAVLTDHSQGQYLQKEVSDPLFRPITASCGISGDGQTAFLEMAAASGLELLTSAERNPLYTTTYGTGQLINYAVEQGVGHIIIGIGGSATNDGGMGMAQALGLTFHDAQGRSLQGIGASLGKVDRINGTYQCPASITVISDVQNPLLGPDGATMTYGEQKGADNKMREVLEAGMARYADISDSHCGSDFRHFPGAGAAGGLGYGLLTFTGAQLLPGSNYILKSLAFEEAAREVDLIITGEGRLDAQTTQGKLIGAICAVAGNTHTPVVALCGQVDASKEDITALGLHAADQISDPALSLQERLDATRTDLIRTARAMYANLSQQLTE
jgi:glycerate kinase